MEVEKRKQIRVRRHQAPGPGGTSSVWAGVREWPASGTLTANWLSPGSKVGGFVFRADEIVDAGTTITIRARVSEEIAHQLEALRDRRYGRERLRFVSRSRVADGELAGVQRTIRAGGAEELTIELANVQPPHGDAIRAGTGGYTADELVELGVRALFLGEPIRCPSRSARAPGSRGASRLSGRILGPTRTWSLRCVGSRANGAGRRCPEGLLKLSPRWVRSCR